MGAQNQCGNENTVPPRSWSVFRMAAWSTILLHLNYSQVAQLSFGIFTIRTRTIHSSRIRCLVLSAFRQGTLILTKWLGGEVGRGPYMAFVLDISQVSKATCCLHPVNLCPFGLVSFQCPSGLVRRLLTSWHYCHQHGWVRASFDGHPCPSLQSSLALAS